MTKLRCPDCKSTHLAKAGKDEWECNECGFSGYSKEFVSGQMTILYSNDKGCYYVKELATPRDFWLSVTKHKRKPKSNWISDVVEFDNSYFRIVLYFTFWKVKDTLNRQEVVTEDNELVRDYLEVQKYLKPKEKIFNPSLRVR